MADNLTNWQNATDNRFDFGKNAYLEAIPDLANANAMATGVAGMQANLAGSQGQLASGLMNRAGTFEGLQDRYITDAFGYNSQAKQDQVAGKAVADVAQQFANTQGQAQRQMSRMGVNPSSGRSLALSNQLGIAQASAQAGAANKARNDLEAVANDRQKTAIGFGANVPAQALSAAQGAMYTGNAAVNAAAAPLNQRLNFAGGISSIYGNAASGYGDIYKTTNLSASQQADLAASQAAADAKEESAFWSGLANISTSIFGDDNKWPF